MDLKEIQKEMSNDISDIQERKAQMEYEISQTENGFCEQSDPHFSDRKNFVEHACQPSSTLDAEILPAKDSSELMRLQENVTNLNQKSTQLQQERALPVKPCIVVLKRSKAVEAALQREQSRKQLKRSLTTSTTIQDGLSKNTVKKHSRQHLSGNIHPIQLDANSGFLCQLCNNSFPGRTSFMQHLRSEHSSTCDICSKVLSSHQKLKDHLRFVHGKSQTTWEQELLPSRPKNFPCKFCYRKFGSQTSLDKHIILKHSELDFKYIRSEDIDSISYKCEYCNDEFNHKLQLREHIYEHHINEKVKDHKLNTQSVPGNVIESSLVDNSAACSEDFEPTGPPIIAYECPHCHTLHANKDRFKKHLGFVWPQSFHEHQVSVDPRMLGRQKEPVNCEVCGARAANLAFLHTHQSAHSELIRPYECPDPCNRKFLFRCQLDRHSLIHQVGAQGKCKSNLDKKCCNETNQSGRHRCTVCSKRTRNEARLAAHIACCHKGDTEFRCKVCDVCFPSSKSLVRHCSKKEHVHDEHNQSCEPWIPPQTPSLSVLNSAAHATQSVRPDSIGSSDSVSTSDAFSMYFQSLHSLGSLDMALDLGGNQSLFDNVNCDDILLPPASRSVNFPTDSNTVVDNQLLQGRPAVTEVTEIINQDNTDGRELQFHTLQTVPLEPLAELEANYLQNMKIEPLSQIEPVTSIQPIEVDTLAQNKSLFVKSEPMTNEVSNSFSQTMTTEVPVKVKEKFQHEQQNTALSQLESYLVLSNDLQNQFPINIEEICSGKDTTTVTPELTSSTVIPKNLPSKSTAPASPAVKVEEPMDTSVPATELPQELNFNADSKEELENTHSGGLHNTCDSSTLDFSSTINSESKSNDIENISDVSNINLLPEADCNIQLLADTCDSSSLSDLGGSNLDSKGRVTKKPSGSCPDCGKIFSSNHSASRHSKLSCPGRDPKSLQVCCPQCDLKLADRKELHKHKREAHPDTLFTCTACNKTFFLAQSLARHQKESCLHRDTFQCRQCKMIMPNLEALRSHSSETHPGTLSTCEICGKTLSSAQSLRRHLRSHKPEDNTGISTDQQLNIEQQIETQSIINETKIVTKTEKLKKKKQKATEETHNLMDRNTSIPRIELVTDNVIEDSGIVNETFQIKTNVEIVSKEEPQVGNISDDILSDFASISTNQLFNGNFHGDSDFQEEFNISDMFLIKNGALQCDFCEASFPTDKLLLRHLSSQHFPNTQWQPAQPAQNNSSSVGGLPVATTSSYSAGSPCDLPNTSS